MPSHLVDVNLGLDQRDPWSLRFSSLIFKVDNCTLATPISLDKRPFMANPFVRDCHLISVLKELSLLHSLKSPQKE